MSNGQARSLMGESEGQMTLSEREREVLFLAGDGLTDKEIAARLNIGTKTVRTYWDRMRAKVGAASRTEVLAKALQSAYDAIAESEQRLRLFVEHMPIMFNAFDEERNLILVNEECSRVTGYARDELLRNEQLWEIALPEPDERARALQQLNENNGDYRDLEFEVTCADGSTRTVAWSSTAKQFPIPGWGSWSIGIDVTERKRARQALAESEARYRQLLESSTQGVWIVDTEHVTTFANQKLADMLGYPVEDLLGKDISTFQEDPSHDTLRDILGNGSHSGSRMIFNHKFRRRDGSVLWASVDVSPLFDNEEKLSGHSAVLTDITHRKRVEQSLRLADQAYRALLENTSDGLIRFTKEFCCSFAGGFIAKQFALAGMGRDELIQVLRPHETWEAKVRQVFEQGEPATFEAESFDKSGKKLRVTLLPEPGDTFGVANVVAFIPRPH